MFELIKLPQKLVFCQKIKYTGQTKMVNIFLQMTAIVTACYTRSGRLSKKPTDLMCNGTPGYPAIAFVASRDSHVVPSCFLARVVKRCMSKTVKTKCCVKL